MGRAINLDMYEGNAAKRIPEGYGERNYSRRSVAEGAGRGPAYRDGNRRTEGSAGREAAHCGGSGRIAGGEGRAAWKEPVCDDRGRGRASGGRATYERGSKDRIASGSGTAGRGAAYEGESRSRTADRRAMYAGENRSCAARRESIYSRGTPGGRKKPSRQNKKRLQRRILGGLCFYFLLAGIIATCWLIVTLFFGKNEKVHAEEGWNAGSKAVSDEALEQESVGAEESLESYGVALSEITPEIRQECQDLYARQEPLLVLANKERELPASCQPSLTDTA